MSISDIIGLLSGIALFLFGMALMGDGLKMLSGNKLGPILYRLSSSPVRGLLLGSGVTAVVQSSSATSVIVVGFVNSGMMKVKQAIPIILGAIFGTCVTGWVICLSYIEGTGSLSSLLSTSTLTGLVAVAGILLRMAGKTKVHKNIGDIMMGFAILMFGMSTMSSSVSGLKEQVWFNSMLVTLKNPMLGILAGILIATVLQSASAAVGIVQALSVTGAVTFDNGLPLLMGISIGAALPVMLSSIGTGTDGKRIAMSYLVASIMGVMTCAAIFYLADAIFELKFMDVSMNPFSIAFVNTIFRLVMTVMLLPFVDILEALVILLVPAKATKKSEQIYLDERFIRHPTLAMEQSRMTVVHMAREAGEAVIDAGNLVGRYSEEGFQEVAELEESGDRYEDALSSFLMKLGAQNLTESQSRESSIFLHTLTDFERISDHAFSIANNAKELHEKGFVLSDEALHELSVMMSAVREITETTIEAFAGQDITLAERVEPYEEVIDDLSDQIKLNHVERLQQGICSIEQGFVFNDLVTNYKRISDHCSNIAVAILELSSGSFATHEYLGTVKANREKNFEQYFKDFQSRFVI